MRLLGLLLILVVSGCFSPVQAAPLWETFGAHHSHQPFNARGVAMDASAAYFAPSLLVHAPKGLRLGFFVMHQEFDIRYQARPDGVDVSNRIYEAKGIISPGGAEGVRYLPTEDIARSRGTHSPSRTGYYLTFGSLHHIIDDMLSLGIYTTIPVQGFQTQRPFFPDEREQFFSNSLHAELYEDRLENSSFAFGLGVKPLSWFSLGAGLTLSMTTTTTSRVYLAGTGGQTPPVVNPEVEVRAGFVPHGSLTFEPLSGFRITGTFHWRYRSKVKTEHRQQMWGYENADGELITETTYRFSYGYEPVRVGLGLSWEAQANPGLMYQLALGSTWFQWSDYRDRQDMRPSDAWSDTFPVTLGTSLRIANMHRVALDLTFVPSPVPEQDGRSNYVDNHRFGAALGYEVYLEFERLSLTLGAAMQGHALLTQSASKSPYASNPILDEFPDALDARSNAYIEESAGLQTNNPGFPGFNSRGWLLGGGLTVTFHL